MSTGKVHPRLIAVFVALLSIALFAQQVNALDNMPVRVSGAYTISTQHPRVFMSQMELDDLAKRINLKDTFSAQMFFRLATRVKSDVSASVDWDAAYSGCDLDVYLHTFSIEEMRGYASDVRSLAWITSELHIRPGAKPPLGAAMVASRSALYAALVKAGAGVPPGAPNPERAAALAKRILLAWGGRGFRDHDGSYRRSTLQFCEQSGAVTPASRSAVGLQVSRGVLYSVHAQDLLQSLGTLRPDEERQLNMFHNALYDVIRDGLNDRFELITLPCDRYSNHVASQLTGLLATARLLDDSTKFLAALYGDVPLINVKLPWVRYFSKAIYGESQKPNQCSLNTGPNGLTSKPSFQTSMAAPGEIDDRFRNAQPLQAIGYSMGTLQYLFGAADILESAGMYAYEYRGTNKQSIESATQYYACYARFAGFKNTVTAENAILCPDYEQYLGKVVNDMEVTILMGANHFPSNRAITSVNNAAKAEMLRDNALDTIHFGRWTD